MRLGRVRVAIVLGLAVSAGGLTGCAELKLGATGLKSVQRGAEDGQRGTYKVGSPYQINGVWYYPAEDFGYAETGIASFYGGESKGVNFHGRSTANGELYDMNTLTAAHQTLPMPSLVRVTNLENGRQLVLRINDRGPFISGRIIDISRRGAQLLGYELQGTARVRVEILAEESRQLKAQLTGQGPPAPVLAEAATAAPRTTVSSNALPAPSGAATAAPNTGSRLPLPSASLPPAAPAPDGRPTARGEAGLPRPAPPVVAQAPGGGRAAAPPPPPAAPGIYSAPAQVAALPPEAQLRAVPTLTQTAVQPTTLWVQAGAFTSYDNASRMSSRLEQFGKPQISTFQSGAQRLYRVRVGPIANVGAADQLLTNVSSVAPGARITVE